MLQNLLALGCIASAAGLVVVNGQLPNGLLPHAYFYRPMSAFSAVTGGVARLYPG